MARTAARRSAVWIWLWLGLVAYSPLLAQEAADPAPATPEAPAASEAEAEAVPVPPAEEPAAKPASAPEGTPEPAEESDELRGLRELRRGFPPGLPFFGAQLMGPSRGRPGEWKNLPIAPFYEVGVGDELVVTAWGSFDLNLRRTVNDQGFVMLSGEDRVYVNGLRFGQIKGRLLEKLRETHAEALAPAKLASGEVSFEVTLGKVRGIQVMITGQLARPGGYTFDQPLVLLMDALTRAGGITARGSLRAIRVTRGSKTTHLDLYDLLTEGDGGIEKYLLRAGDVVTVPYMSRLVSISGGVKQPAIYELKARENLADLIAMAGGLEADADRERIKIRRIDPEEGVRLEDVDLKTRRASSVDILDRDQVTVGRLPSALQGVVTVEGAGVIFPGTYELTPETRELSGLMRKVEFYEDVERDRVLLIRVGPNFVKQKQTLALDRAMAQGFQLQPGDRLIISSKYQLAGGDKQITLSGHVKQPGPYTLAEGLSLYDVLFTYAGLGDPDFRARTHLERGDIVRVDKATGASLLVSFDVGAVLNLDEDHALQSNDQIRLYPGTRFKDKMSVAIEGEVRLPGNYELTQGMLLDDLLSQAGDTSGDAYALQAEVSRARPGRQPPFETLAVPLAERKTFELRNHDMVFVRRIPFLGAPKIVGIRGEVKFPGNYVLKDNNERLAQLVARAGGLSEQAFLEGVQFTRTWEDSTRIVALDMGKAMEGDQRHDIILQDGDTIRIPPRNWAVAVSGAVQGPRLVQYVPGESAGYYVDSAGGYVPQADARATRVVRANGLFMRASRRFWFDPAVPPGSTIVVPEKPPGKPLWRRAGVLGFVGGAVVSSLAWYAAK